MTQRVNQYNLQQFLVDYFDESEQHTLCEEHEETFDQIIYSVRPHENQP